MGNLSFFGFQLETNIYTALLSRIALKSLQTLKTMNELLNKWF